MTLDHATVDDTVLVTTARGEIQPHDARRVGGELDRRLTPQISHVVLDVTDVHLPEACEPALITALLSARRTARQRGTALTVVACGEPFERLVRTTALDELLDLAPSLAGALEGAGVAAAAGGGEREEGRDAVAAAAASALPQAMRCEACGTTWYSRVADLVVDAGMPCARCGGDLALPGAPAGGAS